MGKLNQQTVAERLTLRVRQVKRLKRSCVELGIAGVISNKRGQLSSRRRQESVVDEPMRLVGAPYVEFGPTLVTGVNRQNHSPESIEEFDVLKFCEHCEDIAPFI